VRFDELNWMDVERYLESDDRLMIVLGACEQHAYLSLATDVKVPLALADAASTLAESTEVLDDIAEKPLKGALTAPPKVAAKVAKAGLQAAHGAAKTGAKMAQTGAKVAAESAKSAAEMAKGGLKTTLTAAKGAAQTAKVILTAMK